MQSLQIQQLPSVQGRRAVGGGAASPCSRPTAVPHAFTQARKRRCSKSQQLRALNDTDRDLEAEVEDFMRRQAEAESGLTARNADPSKVLGADEVTDDDAKRMCREIVQVLRTLQEKRDMGANEVKLTIQIEDPRAREQRAMMDIEADVVSRDELAAAFTDVTDGRVPRDRIALRELHKELMTWPFLDDNAPSPPKGQPLISLNPSMSVNGTAGGETVGETFSPPMEQADSGWRQAQARPPVGRDPNEAPQGLADMLPDWVGYGALYGISVLPVIITVAVIAVLFFNSLR